MYRERTGDLFSSKDTAYGHCISRNARMSAGIAKIIKKKFKKVAEIKPFSARVGEVIVVKDTKIVFNLITKNMHYQKPTLQTLYYTLKQMEKKALEMNILYISCPMLACGLDLLKKSEVKGVLRSIFENSPVTVTIYEL